MWWNSDAREVSLTLVNKLCKTFLNQQDKIPTERAYNVKK